MKVKTIELEDDDENRIAHVTVTMSLPEVVFMAKVIGPMTWAQHDAVAPGGGAAGHGIYDCLAGSVLNRFYDDGVNDAVRDLARGAES